MKILNILNPLFYSENENNIHDLKNAIEKKY